jgi:amino acid adenylation domain-containing protein
MEGFNQAVAGLSPAKRALLERRMRAATSQIGRRDEPQRVPLSFGQERIWFLDQLYPNSALYNDPQVVLMRGPLEVNALRASIQRIVGRHEVLRTFIKNEGGRPAAVPAGQEAAVLAIVDLTDSPETEREFEYRRCLREFVERPFDLTCDLPLRSCLIRLDEEQHVLALVLHHVASDGWSMRVLAREIGLAYRAEHGEAPPLASLPIQYPDYAAWQRKESSGPSWQEQRAFWRRQLTGAPTALQLPTSAMARTESQLGERASIWLSRELREGIGDLNHRASTTSFMTLLAAFQVLLHRYSGQDDIVVGAPVANRTRPETEHLIGYFTNTLAMRADLSGDPSFLEFLVRSRRACVDALAHQDIPIEQVIADLKPERLHGRAPVFQVLFVQQNPVQDDFQIPGLQVEPLSVGTGTAKFELTFLVAECGDGIRVTSEYRKDLFDCETVERMLEHYRQLLSSAVSGPDQRLSELNLLPPDERSRILMEWNRTSTEYPRDICIQELFEQQAERQPEGVALVFEGRAITYGELNRRANQLAHYLRRVGVVPGAYVAILAERSAEFVVFALATLKAGGAYVPLDPSHPGPRLTFILSDTGAPVILTQEVLKERLPAGQALILCPGSLSGRLDAESDVNPVVITQAEQPAYVMYTSGSTGTPKGVVIPHRGVVRLVRGTSYAHFGPDEVFLQLAPPSFDASTFELWGSLLNGGRLVIFPPHPPTLEELGQIVRREGVTTLWLTAGLFHQVVETQLDNLGGLRQLLAGGDVLSVSHVAKCLEKLNGCRVINGYGPTEGTTFTCCYGMTGADNFGSSVPIGRPIANTRVYLLDRALQPVPVGVPGELYIGGDGLACGYLNNPDLTAEKFIPDPFSPVTGSRLYRSGDRARYISDGRIEFLGRIDNQVKIRGFRVELGEIEAVLSRHPDIREAVVSCRNLSGETRLVAYLTAARQPTCGRQVRNFLREELPEYMVPSAVVFVDALPLTANGKVDRSALPEPGEAHSEEQRSFVSPRDGIEVQLVRIWEQSLGIRPIGVTDNFFDLGGHSLLAVRMFAEIQKEFGKDFPLAMLFRAPTVEQLALAIRQDRSAFGSCLVPIQPSGTRWPFFVVHGAGGGVLFYADLARYLGLDQPFYGLQAPGFEGEQDPLGRIDAMAAQYVREMRRVQPDGPYFLGGLSMGGVVAFEIAQQLLAEGERIGMLALFDTYRPDAVGHHCSDDARAKYPRRLREGFRERWGNLSRVDLSAQLGNTFSKLRTLGKRIKAKLLGGGHKAPKTPRDIYRSKLHDANVQAMRYYVPKPYAGRIVQFLAGGSPVISPDDPRLAWGKLAAGGLEVHVVPGDHSAMVRGPHAKILAERLSACMEQTIVELRPD